MLALCFCNFVGTSIDVVLAHELEKEKKCGTIFLLSQVARICKCTQRY
jgi:hypothetical protein